MFLIERLLLLLLLQLLLQLLLLQQLEINPFMICTFILIVLTPFNSAPGHRKA